jgi:hypothetical protein
MGTEDLESEDEDLDPEHEDSESPETEDMEDAGDIDPMFAADIAEAFPDLDDTQIAAIQRAVLGLIAGGGAPPAPPAAPMGF